MAPRPTSDRYRYPHPLPHHEMEGAVRVASMITRPDREAMQSGSDPVMEGIQRAVAKACRTDKQGVNFASPSTFKRPQSALQLLQHFALNLCLSIADGVGILHSHRATMSKTLPALVLGQSLQKEAVFVQDESLASLIQNPESEEIKAAALHPLIDLVYSWIVDLHECGDFPALPPEGQALAELEIIENAVAVFKSFDLKTCLESLSPGQTAIMRAHFSDLEEAIPSLKALCKTIAVYRPSLDKLDAEIAEARSQYKPPRFGRPIYGLPDSLYYPCEERKDVMKTVKPLQDRLKLEMGKLHDLIDAVAHPEAFQHRGEGTDHKKDWKRVDVHYPSVGECEAQLPDRLDFACIDHLRAAFEKRYVPGEEEYAMIHLIDTLSDLRGAKNEWRLMEFLERTLLPVFTEASHGYYNQLVAATPEADRPRYVAYGNYPKTVDALTQYRMDQWGEKIAQLHALYGRYRTNVGEGQEHEQALRLISEVYNSMMETWTRIDPDHRHRYDDDPSKTFAERVELRRELRELLIQRRWGSARAAVKIPQVRDRLQDVKDAISYRYQDSAEEYDFGEWPRIRHSGTPHRAADIVMMDFKSPEYHQKLAAQVRESMLEPRLQRAFRDPHMITEIWENKQTIAPMTGVIKQNYHHAERMTHVLLPDVIQHLGSIGYILLELEKLLPDQLARLNLLPVAPQLLRFLLGRIRELIDVAQHLREAYGPYLSILATLDARVDQRVRLEMIHRQETSARRLAARHFERDPFFQMVREADVDLHTRSTRLMHEYEGLIGWMTEHLLTSQDLPDQA